MVYVEELKVGLVSRLIEDCIIVKDPVTSVSAVVHLLSTSTTSITSIDGQVGDGTSEVSTRNRVVDDLTVSQAKLLEVGRSEKVLSSVKVVF